MWLTVRKLARLKFFNWSPLILIGVPILAEFFLELQKHMPFLHFPTILKFGFFAGVFYVLGYALFQLFCPPSVKNYESPEAFAADKLPGYLIFPPDQKLNVVLPQLDSAQREVFQELIRLSESSDPKQKELLQQKVEAQYPSCAQRYLLNEFKRDVDKNCTMAWTALILYCLGSLITVGIVIWRVSVVIKVFKM
jgi:hypothetical protein